MKGIKDWIDANCPGDIIPYSADYEKKYLEAYIINFKYSTLNGEVVANN